MEKEKFGLEFYMWLFTIILGIILFAAGYIIGSKIEKEKINLDEDLIAKEEAYEKDTLSNWDIYMLATFKQESEFNIRIKGCGSYGLAQITQPFVNEANFILSKKGIDSTQFYTLLDALDIDGTIEMFNIVHTEHNPSHDINKSIYIHNPSGDAINYGINIMEKMDFIRKYETIRKKVKFHNHISDTTNFN